MEAPASVGERDLVAKLLPRDVVNDAEAFIPAEVAGSAGAEPFDHPALPAYAQQGRAAPVVARRSASLSSTP